MKKRVIPLLAVLLSIVCRAQVDTTGYDAIEEILEEAILDGEEGRLFDSIEYLMNNPIPLNTAGIKDLLRIPFVDLKTARLIIHHRNLLGGIYNPEQLFGIRNIETDLISRIIPFLKLGDKKEGTIFDSISRQIENSTLIYRFRLLNDLRTKAGFETGKFEGSRPKIYNRLLLKSSDYFSGGLLFEKDSGEKSFTDFSSFHIQLKDLSVFDQIILGDYNFEFGQGLAIWGPYSFSKSPEAINTVSKNSRGSIPYTSTDENQFLRGAAVKLGYGIFSFNPFFSSSSVDASVDSTINQITALHIDGLHRTEGELARKKRATKSMFGIAANANLSENFNIGFLYYRAKYEPGFLDSEKFNLAGKNFEFISSSYSVFWGRAFLSGELAFNTTAVASINNAEFFLSENISVAFSLRNFPRNYISLNSSAFGEKGNARNEVGFYAGLKLRTEIGNFNFYIDRFKFPYTSDDYPFSTNGSDVLIYSTHKLSGSAELRLKYKNESKDIIELINNEKGTSRLTSQNFRAELIYRAGKIQLRSRIEFVDLSKTKVAPEESGYLIFQDIKYAPVKKLEFQARVILFQSDSFSSRLYEFENDLTGVMNNPALYGEGIRWYLLARYKSDFGFTFSFKYAELYKPVEKSLGSGVSMISGNLDNRFSFQIDYRFN